MQFLNAVLVGALVGTLILSGMAIYLRGQLRSQGLGFWILAWLAYALSIILNWLIGSFDSLWLVGLLSLNAILMGLFAVRAAIRSTGLGSVRLANLFCALAALVAAALFVVQSILEPAMAPFWLLTLPALLYLAATEIVAAAFLWKKRSGRPHAPLIALLLFLNGLHQLNYPFLRNVAWFAPYGFAIGAALYIGFQAAVLLQYAVLRERDLNRQVFQLRSLVEALDDYLFVLDTEGRIVEVFGSWVRRMGGSPEDYIGKSPVELLGSQMGEAHRVYLERAIAGEHLSLTFLYPNGEHPRHVQTSLSPVLEDGRVIGVIGVGRDVTDLIGARDSLEREIEENRTLVREIHHRVKNNMQVVSSLLSLRADTMTDEAARRAFEETAGQVSVMAKVHESLYRSRHLSRVDIVDFLGRLVRGVQSGTGVYYPGVRFDLTCDPLVLPIEIALPMGQIIHEALTNALKHGYAPDSPGTITISARDSGTELRISVEDDGAGIAQKPGSGLGSRLTDALCRQIDAEYELMSTDRTRFSMRLPVPSEVRDLSAETVSPDT